MKTPQVDLLRRQSQLVAAPGAGFTGNKAKPPQLEENIIQVTAGNIMQCSNFRSLEAGFSRCYFMEAHQSVAKGRGEQALEPSEPSTYIDKPIGDVPWETWDVAQML